MIYTEALSLWHGISAGYMQWIQWQHCRMGAYRPRAKKFTVTKLVVSWIKLSLHIHLASTPQGVTSESPFHLKACVWQRRKAAEETPQAFSPWQFAPFICVVGSFTTHNTERIEVKRLVVAHLIAFLLFSVISMCLNEMVKYCCVIKLCGVQVRWPWV